MCTQRNPHNWSAALHRRFQEVGRGGIQAGSKQASSQGQGGSLMHAVRVWQVLGVFVEEQVVPGLLASASDPRCLLLELCSRWWQFKALVQEFQRPFHYLVGAKEGRKEDLTHSRRLTDRGHDACMCGGSWS